MLISVVSAKGGVGASSVSALFASALSDRLETLLVDACSGDLHGICGVEAEYSFEDWLNSDKPSAKTLNAIAVDLSGTLSFVASNKGTSSESRTHPFNPEIVIEEIVKSKPGCVLDVGIHQSDLVDQLINASDLVVLVMKQCYLSLMAATVYKYLGKVDVLVVVKENGRSISVDKIADVLHVDCVIELETRKDYARTIDAGVLAQRPPKEMISPIREMLNDALSTQRDVFELADMRHDLFGETKTRNQNLFWEDDIGKTGLTSPFLSAAKKRAGEL